MKPSVKIALGITTALSVMGFIVFWEFVFKDRIDSVEVVVVKAGETIQTKEQITKDKIAIERRSKKDLIQDVVYPDDLKQVIGEDSSQVIVGNSMLSTQMVDFEKLIPDSSNGEAIRPIPGEWIYATPGSLRRKDRVDIYLIDKELIEKLQGKDTQSTDASVKVISEKEEKEIKTILLKPFLKDVPIIYVKDGANKEVINQEGKEHGEQERLNASGKVSELEVLLNEEDFNKIADSVLGKAGRLYITYN